MLSFEGIDGSGKTTQSQRLESARRTAGLQVSALPLYGHDMVEAMLDDLDAGPGVSDASARYAVTAKLLSRFEWHVAPRRADGESFIYDRYLLSFVASELVRGANEEELYVMTRRVVTPDLALVFDIDPQVALTRKEGRVNFHEGGLTLANFLGQAVDYTLFQRGHYPLEWVQQCFLAYQSQVRHTILNLLENETWRERFGHNVVLLQGDQPADDLAAAVAVAVAHAPSGATP